MNNRELYRRSFDRLHPSEQLEMEILHMMNETKSPVRFKPRKLLALAAALVAALSLAVMASASGTLKTVRVWMDGALLGNYTYTTTGESATASPADDITYSVTGGSVSEGTVVELPAPVYALCQRREDRWVLRLYESATGACIELDITDELADGRYADTCTAFGHTCRILATRTGEAVTLDFTVEGAA